MNKFQIPSSEIFFEFSRSSGPGGQNVNKVETKVRARWNFGVSESIGHVEKALIAEKLRGYVAGGEVMVESQKTRSREQNRQDAIDKLEKLVLKAITPEKKRYKTKPTKSSKENRIKVKKLRSNIKNLRTKNYETE